MAIRKVPDQLKLKSVKPLPKAERNTQKEFTCHFLAYLGLSADYTDVWRWRDIYQSRYRHANSSQ